MTKTTPPIKVHHHNDYLVSFYAGRDQTERHTWFLSEVVAER